MRRTPTAISRLSIPSRILTAFSTTVLTASASPGLLITTTTIPRTFRASLMTTIPTTVLTAIPTAVPTAIPTTVPTAILTTVLAVRMFPVSTSTTTIVVAAMPLRLARVTAMASFSTGTVPTCRSFISHSPNHSTTGVMLDQSFQNKPTVAPSLKTCHNEHICLKVCELHITMGRLGI